MATETLVIKAANRTNTARSIRENKEIPVIMYGHQLKSTPLTVNYKDFRTAFQKAGYSTLIDVETEGGDKPVKVIIHDVQFHPVTDQIMHADLFAINMKEKITTSVPIQFVGSSIAVRTFGGMLITNKDSVEIRCLPGDLLHHIEADISKLETFQDALKVRDLAVPPSVEILDDPETMLAHVEEQKVQAVEETLLETAAPAEIELSVKKGKAEEGGEEAAQEQAK